SADIVVATHVEALKRRRHNAAEACKERALDAISERVALFVDGDELLPLHDGADRTHSAAQSRDLAAEEHTAAGMRALRIIDTTPRDAGKNLAGDHTFQRVRSGEATKCKRLEVRRRGIAIDLDAGPV